MSKTVQESSNLSKNAELDELLINKDKYLRSNSTVEILSIAKDLGEQRTREELIPYLIQLKYDNDDTTYVTFAQLFSDFIPFVGGYEHLPLLLPPLEILCSDGEACVREAAVKSLCKIGSLMEDSVFTLSFICLIKNLAGNNDRFNARASACGLFYITYSRVSSVLRDELRSIYRKLCKDNNPVVRKSAFANLRHFASLLLPVHLQEDFIPIIKKYSKETKDSFRLLAVEGCAAVCNQLDPTYRVAHIRRLIIKFTRDTSFRVRYVFADHLHNLCEPFFGNDVSSYELLVPPILKLVDDNYWRVKLAAIEYIPRLARLMGVEFCNDKLVAPCMESLHNKICTIREAGAISMKKLVEEFGYDWAMQHIVPEVLKMADNQQYLCQVTMLNVISLITPIIDAKIVHDKFFPVVLELAEEKMVDVRLSAVKVLKSFIHIIPQHEVQMTIQQYLSDLEDDPHAVCNLSKRALPVTDEVNVNSSTICELKGLVEKTIKCHL